VEAGVQRGGAARLAQRQQAIANPGLEVLIHHAGIKPEIARFVIYFTA
jgi:hypothetical protein